MTELKPCPFCGSAPQMKTRADDHTPTGEITFISCFCGGFSARAHQYGHTPAEAIASWNRRASSEHLPSDSELRSNSVKWPPDAIDAMMAERLAGELNVEEIGRMAAEIARLKAIIASRYEEIAALSDSLADARQDLDAARAFSGTLIDTLKEIDGGMSDYDTRLATRFALSKAKNAGYGL